MPDSSQLSPRQPSTESLLRRAHDGEQGVWSEIYARYHRTLLAVVRRRLGADTSLHDCEEIVQRGLVSAWMKIDKCQYSRPGAFGHWLETIVDNKAIDARRARKSTLATLDTSAIEKNECGSARDGSPSTLVSAGEQLGALLDAMGKLDEDERKIVTLRDLEAQSWQAVAGALGVAESTARQRHKDAWMKLARRFRPNR